MVRELSFRWRQLYLLCKDVRRRKVAVARNEYATDNKHGIVRRGNLCRFALHISLPAGASDEEVADTSASGSFADVGKINVFRRISELYAVIATSHVRNVQNLGSF